MNLLEIKQQKDELYKIKYETDNQISKLNLIEKKIVQTEKEIESYGKRLWALQEKGFTIKVLQ